ncbi:hypothetical protein JXA70_05125, partial [candidate division KSB1 bacterium]|nr:hypothetical protein [candidate division KSB1 bacterium]
LWSEVHQNVQVKDGYFSAILGSIKQIDVSVFEKKERYLEIKIKDETLSPRQKIASSAYAYAAAAVHGQSNTFPSDGNVGIGTNQPDQKLHVNGIIKTGGVKFSDDTEMTTAPKPGDGSFKLPYAGNTNSIGSTGFSITHKSQGGHAIEAILDNCSYSLSNGDPVETAAVKGFANGKDEKGISYGGYFASWSGKGMGVWGGSGGTNGIGVYGEANGNNGFGVYGKSKNIGVYGEVSGSAGYGLYGKSYNKEGFAIYGENKNGGKAANFLANGSSVLELENTGDGYVIDAETKNYGIDLSFTSVGGMLRSYVLNDRFGWFFHTQKGRRQILADNYGISISANENEIDHIVIREKGHVGIGTVWPQARLHVEGDMRCDVVTITGGSDIAEPFDISQEIDIKSGMVMSIDAENPGQLKAADVEYDRCVAGIVSGAGGIAPGMIMGQDGSIADGEHAIALSGRVYCFADASNGAIEPGDLLTTSTIKGHAMKATDHTRAQGAIIGKALTALESGRSLVLVLVSLQ